MSHSSSRSRSRTNAGARYEESDFPTKADYGDGDEYMIPREVDLNEHKDKYSGWTNPLSWEDDGSDDDQILNMGYDYSKLKEKEDTLKYGNNDLDQDIKDTLENEVLSEDLVAKQRAKWAEMEAAEAAEEAALEAKLTKASKKGKAAADEEESAEKQETKKAPKNAAKKEEAAKAGKKESADKKEPAAEASNKEEKPDEGESKDAGKKEEAAEAKPAKAEKKEAAKEEKKPAAEGDAKAKEGADAKKEPAPPKEAKIQSSAQISVPDLSDAEVNYIQKRLDQAQTTDLLDQDLSIEPYDI